MKKYFQNKLSFLNRQKLSLIKTIGSYTSTASDKQNCRDILETTHQRIALTEINLAMCSMI